MGLRNRPPDGEDGDRPKNRFPSRRLPPPKRERRRKKRHHPPPSALQPRDEGVGHGRNPTIGGGDARLVQPLRTRRAGRTGGRNPAPTPTTLGVETALAGACSLQEGAPERRGRASEGS